MQATFMTLTLVAVLGADVPAKSESTRKPHPFAPSLRELSEEEEAAFDQIIDDFIRQDTGALKGTEGEKALEKFRKLPPGAIFALIRGLNRTSALPTTHSAGVIGTKIAAM